MILKLRNNKIIIADSGTPERTTGVPVVFDYELGTNHYTTRTTIAGTTYLGSYIEVPLDLKSSAVDIMVELIDTHDTVIKTYTGTFTYLKLCLIDDDNIINVYEQLKQLLKENRELKEKGDVI